jgi:prephenate dehydrogenase
MPTLVRRLAVFGPGLLGGSLAGAVRRLRVADEIRVWSRRADAAERVVARGWADLGTTEVETAAEGADFVVLATPVRVMPELARRLVGANLGAGALVTDVGSVKGFVEREVAPIFDQAGITFIGSHPMAGAETAGFDSARDDLFDGAACVLTPHAASLPRLRAFWEALGCRLSVMTPAEHDAAVARISHLPHLAASATALAALDGDPAAARIGGPGFRDTTRVASGDPPLWTEILLENRDALERPIEDLIRRLGEALDFLRRADEQHLRQFLAEAKRLRDEAAEARLHG